MGRCATAELLAEGFAGNIAGEAAESGKDDQQGRHDLQRPCCGKAIEAAERGAGVDGAVPGRVLRMAFNEYRRANEIRDARVKRRQRPHRRGNGAADVRGGMRIDHALAVPQPCLLLRYDLALLGLLGQPCCPRGNRRPRKQQQGQRAPQQAPLAPHQLQLGRGNGQGLAQGRCGSGEGGGGIAHGGVLPAMGQRHGQEAAKRRCIGRVETGVDAVDDERRVPVEQVLHVEGQRGALSGAGRVAEVIPEIEVDRCPRADVGVGPVGGIAIAVHVVHEQPTGDLPVAHGEATAHLQVDREVHRVHRVDLGRGGGHAALGIDDVLAGKVQRNAGLAGVEVVGGIEIDAALGSERVVAEAVVEDDLAAGFIGTWRQGIRACPRYEQA
ncbi:hypothetical protein G6F57_015589 [Rhizopus arrhizus]|nr:hypothetical protein G6F57_015589 [Rhizopus arrhizus]